MGRRDVACNVSTEYNRPNLIPKNDRDTIFDPTFRELSDGARQQDERRFPLWKVAPDEVSRVSPLQRRG